jgi:hypothetical protein
MGNIGHYSFPAAVIYFANNSTLRFSFSPEFQKVGILGPRVPDIIFEKSGHFCQRLNM